MKRLHKPLGALAVASSLVMLLAACGGGAAEEPSTNEGDLVIDGELIADADLLEAAQAEGSIIFYTGRQEAQEKVIAEAFTADTGITVEVLRLGGADLQERILTEYGAGVLKADVIRSGGIPFTEELLEEGIIQSYETSTAAGFPEEYTGEDFTYYSTDLGLMGIGYNTAVIDAADAPESFEDLTDPKYKDMINILDLPTAGESSWVMESLLRNELGTDWYEDFAKNNPVPMESSTVSIEAVVRGDYPIAINALSVVNGQKATGAPVEFVFPKEGVAVYPLPISLSTTGEHVNAAQVYLNWVTSKHGQTISAETPGANYQARDDVPTPVVDGESLPPLSSINVYNAPTITPAERQQWVADWKSYFE